MKKLTLYYLILLAIVGGKTLMTLYERSVVIHHGNLVFEMQKEKQELQQQKLSISSQLSQKNSIVSISNSENIVPYQPISKTVTVTVPSLASSQLY